MILTFRLSQRKTKFVCYPTPDHVRLQEITQTKKSRFNWKNSVNYHVYGKKDGLFNPGHSCWNEIK